MVFELVVTIVLVVEARPEDRARVLARQGGGIANGAVGGWTGAWAGCAGLSLPASPSLEISIIGEGGTEVRDWSAVSQPGRILALLVLGGRTYWNGGLRLCYETYLGASMSILDRLNRRIAARVHGGRSKIVIDGGQLLLFSDRGREQLPLAELTAATLSHSDVCSGDAVVRRLGFTGGRQAEVFKDDPCWFDLMAALDRTGAIYVPSAEWQLRFLSAGEGAAPIDLIGAAQR